MIVDYKIAKIVGASGNISWAQNHVFIPKDEEKKRLSGSLLTSLFIKAKASDLALAAFGKEIISRFHEIYYSSLQKEILLRLKLSLESLIKEFKDRVEIEISSAVLIERKNKLILYAGLFGYGKILILRNGRLGIILEKALAGISVSSGYLEQEDYLILGTGQFFSYISLPQLLTLFNQQTSNPAEEAALLIHSQKNNSHTAALFIQINLSSSLTKEIIAKEQETPLTKPSAFSSSEPKLTFKTKKTFISNIKGFTSSTGIFINALAKIFNDFRKQPGIYLHDKEKKKRAQRTTLSVGVILIILLIISIYFGSKQKNFIQNRKNIQEISQKANGFFDEAVTLIEINPDKAKSLLEEAKTTAENGMKELKTEKNKEILKEILANIENELQLLTKTYKIEKADLFLDLSLAKDGFRAQSWVFDKKNLLVLDGQKGTVLAVSLIEKTTRVASGGEKVINAQKIGADDNNLFILRAKELILIDSEKGEYKAKKEIKEVGEIKALVGFGSNAYLLDPEKHAIWKFVQLEEGLSSPKNYLISEAYLLDEAVDMAIDGSVWVLFPNGTIVKFTRGIKDNFNLKGLQGEFKETEKIYTDANLDNLYILDRQNTRIVVVNKTTNEYVASYVWPGIAGIIDFFASEEEGKILFLTSEKIYEIPIRGK